MLHGRNNENILHMKDFFSHGKRNLLFLPCNMAAVQNLYIILETNRVMFSARVMEGNVNRLPK